MRSFNGLASCLGEMGYQVYRFGRFASCLSQSRRPARKAAPPASQHRCPPPCGLHARMGRARTARRSMPRETPTTPLSGGWALRALDRVHRRESPHGDFARVGKSQKLVNAACLPKCPIRSCHGVQFSLDRNRRCCWCRTTRRSWGPPRALPGRSRGRSMPSRLLSIRRLRRCKAYREKLGARWRFGYRCHLAPRDASLRDGWQPRCLQR